MDSLANSIIEIVILWNNRKRKIPDSPLKKSGPGFLYTKSKRNYACFALIAACAAARRAIGTRNGEQDT